MFGVRSWSVGVASRLIALLTLPSSCSERAFGESGVPVHYRLGSSLRGPILAGLIWSGQPEYRVVATVIAAVPAVWGLPSTGGVGVVPATDLAQDSGGADTKLFLEVHAVVGGGVVAIPGHAAVVHGNRGGARSIRSGLCWGADFAWLTADPARIPQQLGCRAVRGCRKPTAPALWVPGWSSHHWALPHDPCRDS